MLTGSRQVEPRTARLRVLALMLVVISLWSAPASAYERHNDKVRLTDISALTLHKGKFTTGRRSSPVPQAKCVGGTAGCAHAPATIQCVNRGNDGYEVQWECTAELEAGLRFGLVEVVCEGYDYPEDPYVLRGSCGLEFSLDGSVERHHHDDGRGQDRSYYYHHQDSHRRPSSDGGDSFVTLVVMAIIFGVVYWVMCTPNRGARQGGTNWGSGTSGGGGGGFDGGPGYPGSGGYPSQSYAPGCSPSAPPPPEYNNPGYMPGPSYRPGGGGPGFWTGMGVGGLVGNMMGRNWGGGYRRPYYQQPGYGGGMFGGRPAGGAGMASSSARPAAPAPRTATGYGGTRRR